LIPWCVDFGEVFSLCLGKQIYLDANAREHGDDRLADRLVIDIAVVWTVEPDLEPIGIAGFGDQLLGAGRVIGISFVERRIKTVYAGPDHQRRRTGKAAHDLRLD